MPAASQKKSSTRKLAYDGKGRAVSTLLKAKIRREQKAGLVLTAPDGKLRLSVEAAAAKYHVSPWTLRDWVSTGRLKYVRFGRQLRFTDEDILAAANSVTVGA